MCSRIQGQGPKVSILLCKGEPNTRIYFYNSLPTEQTYTFSITILTWDTPLRVLRMARQRCQGCSLVCVPQLPSTLGDHLLGNNTKCHNTKLSSMFFVEIPCCR